MKNKYTPVRELAQITEQQLKDAEILRSSSKESLISRSEAIKIKAPNPMFECGEWRIEGYHHRGGEDE